MNKNEPQNKFKNILNSQVKKKAEHATELGDTAEPELKPENDALAEKPDVDPGIDYMKWSD